MLTNNSDIECYGLINNNLLFVSNILLERDYPTHSSREFTKNQDNIQEKIAVFSEIDICPCCNFYSCSRGFLFL